MPDDKDFLEELKTHQGGFGAIIKNLIADSPRILLNFPLIGRARKISLELENEAFSIFYKYERTLSNKLHPFLYRHNLNVITNGRIESFFNSKFSPYEPLMPRSLENIKGATYDEKLEALSSLKRIITAMAADEGHFMVIKFLDYIYSTINPDISNILRSVEFKLNYLKPRLTGSEEANLELVQKKYREFKNIYNDHDAELLIERMKWDPQLSKYALIIEKEEESAQKGSSPSGKIERYAALLKKKYLDSLEDTDTEGIKKVIDAVNRSNEEQHGEIKASAIIEDILKAWLEMDSISREKKNSIQSIGGFNSSDSSMPGQDTEEHLLSPSAGESLSAEDMANEIFNNNGMDDETSGDPASIFDSTEPVDEKPDSDVESFSVASELLADDLADFEITETNGREPGKLNFTEDANSDAKDPFAISETGEEEATGTFDLAETNDKELSDFTSAEEGSDGAGPSFNISDDQDSEAAEGFPISGETDREMQKLFALVAENISRLTENYNLKADAFDVSTLQTKDVSMILTSEILRETRTGLLSAMEHSGDDVDLFLKIIRYLENGPFPEMTLSEQIRLMDSFIEKFKKNTDLTEKLITYRDTMTSRQSLLDEVFSSLYNIKEKSPDTESCRQQQLAYLGGLLVNEDYSPVWKTLQLLYENIASGNTKGTCSRISAESPGHQVEILNRLKELEDNPEFQTAVAEMLISEQLQDAQERYSREHEKSPDSLEEIIRQVMKEDIDLDSWIKNIGSDPEDDRAAEKDTKAAIDPAGVKNRMKEMFTTGDWSDPETANEFSALLKSLISHESEKSLPFMEKILSHEMIPDEAKETVLDNLQKSDIPLFQEISEAHRLLESSPDHETAGIIIDKFHELHKETLPKSLINDMKKFIQIKAKSREKEEKVLELLREENDSPESALNNIAENPSTPPSMKNSMKKLSTHLTSGNIEEAIRAITGSSSTAALKTELLEKLKEITLAKNISLDDPVIKKIERKIAFYKQITVRSESNRNLFKEKSQKFINSSSPSADAQKGETTHDRADTPEVDKKKSSKEPDSQPEETSILGATISILKVFSDNINSLEPVIGLLKEINSPKEHASINQEVSRIKRQEETMVTHTLEMIDDGEINHELLKEIQKISPRAQYRWAASLQEKKGEKKLEDVFSTFIKNKKLPDEINRLVRVIYSNNQNNFLKDSIDREQQLINKIASDFSTEGLKKLRSKTRNSQDRDRINIFRDILKMAGPAKQQTGKKSSSMTPAQNSDKITSLDTGLEGPAATPSKKYKDAVVEQITAYLSSDNSKSEKVRLASKIYIKDINDFLNKTAGGDEQAIGVINQHPREFSKLFSHILRNKKQESFPISKKVILHCLDLGIIQPEDL